jgi:hypothetical protein
LTGGLLCDILLNSRMIFKMSAMTSGCGESIGKFSGRGGCKMFQIVYEYAEPWPQQGTLQIQPPAFMQIAVSPNSARRKANGYLTMHISMSLLADKPVLVMRQRPVWRVPLEMRLQDLGHIATLGVIEVDAQTREIIRLSSDWWECGVRTPTCASEDAHSTSVLSPRIWGEPIIPPTAQQIRAIQDQANELIARLTPEATATI